MYIWGNVFKLSLLQDIKNGIPTVKYM